MGTGARQVTYRSEVNKMGVCNEFSNKFSMQAGIHHCSAITPLPLNSKRLKIIIENRNQKILTTSQSKALQNNI